MTMETLTRAPIAVSQQQTAKRTRFYAPELDALRFMAFLLVFCRHVVTYFGGAKHREVAAAARTATSQAKLPPVWEMIQGVAGCFDFGVCLFFFLSSFLITKLLLIEREQTGTVAIRDFYIRRSLRIWPLYFLFLAVMSFISLFAPVLHITWPRVIASCFFAANIPVLFHGWTGSPIEPLWSVSLEEQFYLVWPGFAVIGRRAILYVSAAMAVISIGSLVYLGGAPYSKVWPNTLVQCIFFSGGALTGVFFSSPQRKTLPQRVILFVSGFVCWITASSACHIVKTEGTDALHLIGGYLLVLAGTFLILISILGAKLNLPGYVTHLGKISYGLYVFHVFFLQMCIGLTSKLHAPLIVVHFGSAMLALAATIACAALSYKYLEAPFLTLKKRFTTVQSRPI
jgi:peptidoglycan/LPS O-acetylase OafA/YrhL